VNNLANTLQPLHPKIIAAEPAISDHRSFYAKQIPSIQFISGPIPKAGAISENIEFDYLERETEYLYNFAVALANGPAPSFSPTDIERPERATEVVSWSDCDVKPAFMNNPNPSVFLERWVYVYLKYPQYAIDNGIQGKVLVDFVIDEKGKVKDVKVLKGVHPSLDDEAVKVVSASPDWKPARVRGKKVPCAISLYVEFRLKKK
jgi:TonB family protein